MSLHLQQPSERPQPASQLDREMEREKERRKRRETKRARAQVQRQKEKVDRGSSSPHTSPNHSCQQAFARRRAMQRAKKDRQRQRPAERKGNRMKGKRPSQWVTLSFLDNVKPSSPSPILVPLFCSFSLPAATSDLTRHRTNSLRSPPPRPQSKLFLSPPMPCGLRQPRREKTTTEHATVGSREW